MKVLFVIVASLGLFVTEAPAQCFGGRCGGVVVAPAVVVQRQVVVRRGLISRNRGLLARQVVVRQRVIVAPVVQQVVVRRQVVVASPVVFNPVFSAPLVAPGFTQHGPVAPAVRSLTADLNSVNEALRKLQCIQNCLNQ